MSVEILTFLFFGSLLLFLLLGVPLTFVLGGVSIVFLYSSMGPVSFYIVASKFWDSMTNFTLVAIPMYVFMAMVLEKSGVAHALYRMMHLWFGGLRGGLAIGTVAICAIFAAMSGISGAAVVTMGTIALPRMLERGYDTKLSLDDYIQRAGGYTQNADNSRIVVAHRDGSFDQGEDGLKLREGDEVLVLPKVDVKSRQIVKDMTQILYYIAVSAAVVLGL